MQCTFLSAHYTCTPYFEKQLHKTAGRGIVTLNPASTLTARLQKNKGANSAAIKVIIELQIDSRFCPREPEEPETNDSESETETSDIHQAR